jgi:hypothetical protein
MTVASDNTMKKASTMAKRESGFPSGLVKDLSPWVKRLRR